MRQAVYVGLVSAAALACEVQLLRLLGFQHWHAFAALIIGLALFGYAASGTLLALAEARGFRPGPLALRRAGLALAVSIPLCATAAQRVPFNALEWIWNPLQAAWMTALMGLLAMPFLSAGAAIVMAFRSRPEGVPALYAGDLIGASAGAALAGWVLASLSPATAMALCAGLAFIAALLAAPSRRPGIDTLLAAAIVAGLAGAGEPRWRLNPYKGQALALAVDGARLIEQRATRHGVLASVESPRIPPRWAPGMSLLRGAEPPDQRLVFLDGDQASTIDRPSADSAYLTETVAATAGHLQQPSASVLLAGVGTGLALRRAQAMTSGSIVAVDGFAERIDLLARRHADFAGHPLADSRVRVVHGQPRRVLPSLGRDFDRVVLAGADSLTAATSGVGSLSSDAATTVEAWMDALDRLGPDGLAVWTGWLQLPPRRVPKQLATVRDALAARGVARPDQHVIVVRDWSVATVIVSPRPLPAHRQAALANWVDSRGFDRVCDPWMVPEQANRHHRWRQPLLHQACLELLGPEWRAFQARYRFDLRAATDDRPFPDDTFRWGLLAELGRPAGGAILLESGTLTQLAALAIGGVFALLLVALPMAVRRDSGSRADGATTIFFLAVGAGFLFIEIGLLLKATLWLGRPADAFVVTLVGLLIGAGIGSAASSRVARRAGLVGGLARALMVIAGVTAGLAGLATGIDRTMLALPYPAAAGGILACFAGVGYFMGRFLPSALGQVLDRHPRALPWCWAINGAASVLASAASLLIAADLGIRALLITGAACYGLAVAAARKAFADPKAG